MASFFGSACLMAAIWTLSPAALAAVPTIDEPLKMALRQHVGSWRLLLPGRSPGTMYMHSVDIQRSFGLRSNGYHERVPFYALNFLGEPYEFVKLTVFAPKYDRLSSAPKKCQANETRLELPNQKLSGFRLSACARRLPRDGSRTRDLYSLRVIGTQNRFQAFGTVYNLRDFLDFAEALVEMDQ